MEKIESLVRWQASPRLTGNGLLGDATEPPRGPTGNAQLDKPMCHLCAGVRWQQAPEIERLTVGPQDSLAPLGLMRVLCAACVPGPRKLKCPSNGAPDLWWRCIRRGGNHRERHATTERLGSPLASSRKKNHQGRVVVQLATRLVVAVDPPIFLADKHEAVVLT